MSRPTRHRISHDGTMTSSSMSVMEEGSPSDWIISLPRRDELAEAAPSPNSRCGLGLAAVVARPPLSPTATEHLDETAMPRTPDPHRDSPPTSTRPAYPR